MGQKIPANSQELALDFMKVVRPMVEGAEVVANMDETPLWFDLPSESTIDTRGVKTVLSKTTGYEKLR